MMYLMRSKHWSAEKAKQYVIERRSLVTPNDGFWRTLCALEGSLGIADRYEVTIYFGADMPHIFWCRHAQHPSSSSDTGDNAIFCDACRMPLLQLACSNPV